MCPKTGYFMYFSKCNVLVIKKARVLGINIDCWHSAGFCKVECCIKSIAQKIFIFLYTNSVSEVLEQNDILNYTFKK